MSPATPSIPIQRSWGVRVATSIVRGYQHTFSWDHQWRYWVGGMRVCRYYPSCSQYMIDAIERFGVIKGMMMGLRRLLRCNPFTTGGVDDIST